MAFVALSLVGCNPDKPDGPDGPDGPVIGPTSDVPEIADPADNAVTFALNIPDGVCKDVYMEGAYEGWSIDVATATKFAALEGYENWYVATVTCDDMGEAATMKDWFGACKVLLSDEEGNIPGDWSSQWNSDKVTVLEGPAELVDDQGQKALNYTGEGGDVVYIKIEGWQNKPCAFYGVATAAQIKCASIVDGDGNGWNYADMVADGNGTFHYDVALAEGAIGNMGCNIGVVVDGELIESWNALDDVEGAAAGVNVRYTFVSENGPKGTVTIQKL